MKKNFWDKRIPTLLGILLIAIGVGVTTFLVKQGALFQSNASPSEQPQNVRITNITENTFTVSYTTDDKVIGSINYGKSTELGQSGLDDRDQESGSLSTFNVHNITVRNLGTQTKYYFTITSGKDTYMNNSQPFEVTTAQAISSSPTSQEPMSGKVILPDGSAPSEGIIYVTSDNSQVISSLLKSDGTYVLPLNSIRTADLSSYYVFPADANVKMLVTGNSLTSNVNASINQIHPVPVITLSNDYDFKTNESPVASDSAGLQSFPSFSDGSNGSAGNTPEIITPDKNQSFTDQQPEFKGKALPNETVEVTIHSDPTKATVTTDKNGNWTYRPTTPLPPGNHTITIITKNAGGILKTITQSFVVFAAGTQVSGSATPSGTLTPTPTNAPTDTPTPTVPEQVTETPTPTLELSPTATSVSITPFPTTKPLPATGNPFIIGFGFIGILLSLSGAFLILNTRGRFFEI